MVAPLFYKNNLVLRDELGEIVDVVDIENKILRVLHDESFIDDPTRIIREFQWAGHRDPSQKTSRPR